MKVFVRVEARETLAGKQDDDIRGFFGKFLPTLLKNPKYVSGHVFTDARGGYLILDIGAPEELWDLTAPMLPYFKMETHPVAPFEKVIDLFKMIK